MKVTVEFVIRDDKGNILSQNSRFPMEIGTQSLYDIEGCVEQMKNKVLPEIELSFWTVRSSRKINEFTRVSAPNAPQPSSGLTITEKLSLQGF